MTDTMTEPLVSDEAFQNLFIRYCNMQDGHDLIIVRKADAGELIAMTGELIKELELVRYGEGVCFSCLQRIDKGHTSNCLITRAEALLARMDKGEPND